MSEKFEFQAEVSRLLDIVANALYSEKEIFLRELISNASDACDKRRYIALSDNALSPKTDYQIRLFVDTDARTLKITDNGVGMGRDELIENLGTIAHSGTQKMLDALAQDKEAKANGVELIGQFGVGFYSAFMVADKVEVLTRKAGDEEGYQWISDGKGAYTIDEALKDEVGTEITLFLNDDSGEYLLEERLKHIVKTYSDHISVPIMLGADDDAAPINKASAIWTRSKSDITDEEYKEFYNHVSGGMSMDTPFKTIHWRAEGAIEFTNLLYIPGMKPFDLYDPKRHHAVRLFVKRVFITDGVEGLVPPFLRFIRGVVDSEDLPLNISREMLQNNPVVTKISSALTRRVLDEMIKMADKEPEQFEQMWALFGPVIKEGLYDQHQYRDQLTKLVRFYSLKSQKLISLPEYVENMQEGQEHIYYMSGAEVDTLRNSPQLEGFKAKDVDVLFMTDTIDEYWLPMQNSFDSKEFKSVTKGDAGLDKIAATDKKDEDASSEEAQSEKIQPLLTKLKEVLGDDVKDVCVSKRLTDSAVCLVAGEKDVDMNLERMLKNQQGYEEVSRRILEINESHPVIVKLQDMVANDAQEDVVKDAALLLLDQARIVEGDPLPNPSEFARRMSSMMAQGLLG